MMSTYLKHVITVNSEQGTAHVIVDGVRRCFLNGEAEARRFLRERAWGHYYWPRRATYEVVEDGVKPRELGSSASRAVAESDIAWFRADENGARPVFLRRIEWCPVPGCDGHGQITERGRGAWVVRNCPQHIEPQIYNERGSHEPT